MTAARRIPDHLLDAIRDRLPLLPVVQRRVRLEKAGTAWWKGLCPFHSEKTPSFGVKPADRSFHCFGCGARGDVVTWMMRLEGLDFPAAVRRCAEEAGIGTGYIRASAGAPWAPAALPPPVAEAPVREASLSPQQRTALAWTIWDRGEGISAGSPVAQYLDGRGLWPLPQPCHAVLRAARRRHQQTGDALHPVLLARIDAPDGRFAGVHTTWLAPRAEGGWDKLDGVGDPRRSLGPLWRGAIRLFPAAPRLGVAERIETALAAHRLSGLPVWSCLNAGALGAVDLPFDVEELVIFADRDAPKRRGQDGHQGPDMPEGAGIFHARHLARRQRQQAVKVEIRAPHECGDYADLWLAQQRAGQAA